MVTMVSDRPVSDEQQQIAERPKLYLRYDPEDDRLHISSWSSDQMPLGYSSIGYTQVIPEVLVDPQTGNYVYHWHSNEGPLRGVSLRCSLETNQTFGFEIRDLSRLMAEARRNKWQYGGRLTRLIWRIRLWRL